MAVITAVALATAGWAAEGTAKTAPNQNLPKPDSKPTDMTRPVKVFIMMRQSNMVGMGEATTDENPERTSELAS